MVYIKTILALSCYIFILLSVYFCYINLIRVDVVFYSSLYSAAIALLIFSFIIFLVPLFRSFTGIERMQNLIIGALLGYIFAISLPTVIDRSLSFYILEKLQQRDGGIQLAKFNYIFTNEYMREHHLVDVRITEQVESGTIVIDGDCVRLTPRGESLAFFSRWFRQNLLPKKRLLRGEYTDQLIDPFARSDEVPDYLCK